LALVLTQLAQPATPAPTLAHPIWGPPIAHAAILLTTLRGFESVLYPLPFAQADDVPRHYADAYTKLPIFDTHAPAFEWDHDPWTINVIGHGLMGSELYIHARMCNFGWPGSFAFAAIASTTWEFGFEASGVRPSAWDLVYTPIAGLLLGEARFQLARVKALRPIVDPFGELGRSVLKSPC
jgi:hypothetical protein